MGLSDAGNRMKYNISPIVIVRPYAVDPPAQEPGENICNYMYICIKFKCGHGTGNLLCGIY